MKQDKQIENKTASDKSKAHKNHVIGVTATVMWFLTVILYVGASFVYGKETGEIIQTLVFSSITVSGFVYTYVSGNIHRTLSYDNNDHPVRFFHLYCLTLVLSVIFPLMDEGAWTFPCFGVMLAVLSEPFTGLAAISTLIINTCLLSASKGSIAFIVYFSATIIAIMLFRTLDENFSFFSALIISIVSQFCFEICGFVLLKNSDFSFEQFIIPSANMIINGIVLFGFLKYFNDYIANKYRNKFLELNDQEYKIFVQLKENNPKEYMRSIHTAYLVERMAKAIDNCDVNLAKNCAYYHRIKNVYNMTNEQCEDFIRDNEFPPQARETLMEYFENTDKLVSKETSIVYISDTLISTLMKLFNQNSKIDVDYNKVIDSLFEKEYFISTLDDSDLTKKDYRNIKEIMKRERLYYDFLR